jgi:hypothetical protein
MGSIGSAIGPGESLPGGRSSTTELIQFIGKATIVCTTKGGTAVTAEKILISRGSVLFYTNQSQLFGIGPSGDASTNLTIMYDSVTQDKNEDFKDLNVTFLHIGKITLPRSGDWKFCFSKDDFE